jgi:hypothetical protein
MKGIIDYGDDGVIPMINSEEVENVISDILDHVEARFEILDGQDRQADILALCEEFHEWGTAKAGDVVSYYTVPKFE